MFTVKGRIVVCRPTEQTQTDEKKLESVHQVGVSRNEEAVGLCVCGKGEPTGKRSADLFSWGM